MTFYFFWIKNLKMLFSLSADRPNPKKHNFRNVTSTSVFFSSGRSLTESMEHTYLVDMETCSFQMPSHHFTTIRWRTPPWGVSGSTPTEASWHLHADHENVRWFWTHLEVDDHCEDKDGGDEIHEVGEVLAVEGLPKGSDLVSACGQQVKQCNDSTFKFHPCQWRRGHMR